MPQAPVIYFDVDDTLVRFRAPSAFPFPPRSQASVLSSCLVARLFLWSTGGAEYARSTAVELGLAECFEGFLPKPNAIVDDQAVSEWRNFCTSCLVKRSH